MTLDQLCACMPRLKVIMAKLYLAPLQAAMAEFEINSNLRVSAFLAQLAHESGELRYFEELADGKAYEGRIGLGNTEPGDGPKYKGRGPIQLTGRKNYRLAGAALGLDLEDDPTYAATPDVGFRIAGWYWKTHDCNSLADAGRFDAITRKINGGLNGKTARDMYYARALKVFGIVQ